MEDKITDIEKAGLNYAGKSELTKHLEGGRLTQKQDILAKCYDCMGYFVDGKASCLIESCSLYPYMRFNPNRVKSVARKGTSKINFNVSAG